MTRMSKLGLALALALGWSGVASAECPQGMVLKKIGNAQTASAAVSAQGQDVMGVNIDCGASACTAGFYNVDTLGETANGNLAFEAGGAANATAFIDLTDSPIYFSDGVTFVDDGNVDAIVLYSCQPR